MAKKKYKEKVKTVVVQPTDEQVRRVLIENTPMKEGHGYVAMYLLYMQHPTGTIWDFNDLRRMSYEEIRADRTSIVD